ncbi:NrfD/PsrC family molybdoenzyme membrane anchor subunit [candidate division KSB1 bacterium]
MRVKIVKSILWFLFGIGTVVGISRFIFGLGAATNLTDSTPWGLWIGFDVMGGVALAAGGFVIAGAVYVFRLETFRPVVRPAVLTAFLGYIAVAVGLLFDLGIPWHIWHLMIFWNPHSPLFEVGWCVMLYLAVLLLEFTPVVLERFPRFHGIYHILKKTTIPLVILDPSPVVARLSDSDNAVQSPSVMVQSDHPHPLSSVGDRARADDGGF